MFEADSSARYRSYLLSVWRENGGQNSERTALRFRLQDPRTGERRGLGSPEALVDFLVASLTAYGEHGEATKSEWYGTEAERRPER
jgi:hypothetical protein